MEVENVTIGFTASTYLMGNGEKKMQTQAVEVFTFPVFHLRSAFCIPF